MASKSKRARTVKQRNLAKDFMYWALAVFFIKLIIISNIPGGAWYAADGENYINGFNALVNEGIFAKARVLTYWPAGYPILIYFLNLFGQSWVLISLAIFQSAVFSFSVYYFSKSLLHTKISKYSYFVLLLILLNPTLSLSSMAVGYESLAASGYLLITGLVVRDLAEKKFETFWKPLCLNSTIISFLGFIQPRLIPGGLFLMIVWILIKFPKKFAVVYILISLCIALVLPSTLVYRNYESVGIKSISTNLGATMNIGAGDNSTGGYDSKVYGVNCDTDKVDESKADQQLILCVLNWYKDNPASAIKLFWNKSIYFWSPWSGPILSGTMRLNPWLKINPIVNISQTPDGSKLVSGMFGKLMAITWIISGLFLMFFGLYTLLRMGKPEKFIGAMVFLVILSSWLITLISIGDHRFRLPIMGMSLFLQAVGIRTLFKGGKLPMVDGPGLR